MVHSGAIRAAEGSSAVPPHPPHLHLVVSVRGQRARPQAGPDAQWFLLLWKHLAVHSFKGHNELGVLSTEIKFLIFYKFTTSPYFLNGQC